MTALDCLVALSHRAASKSAMSSVSKEDAIWPAAQASVVSDPLGRRMTAAAPPLVWSALTEPSVKMSVCCFSLQEAIRWLASERRSSTAVSCFRLPVGSVVLIVKLLACHGGSRCLLNGSLLRVGGGMLLRCEAV